MAWYSLVVLFLSCIIGPQCFSYAEMDTLKQGQLLHDWEQLISAEGIFKLGFFNLNSKAVELGPSGPRYLGIWYVDIPFYPVWVANSQNPIPDSSGALTIDSDGPLKISYIGGPAIVINSNQASTTSSGNMTATLLDTGNFVVRQVDANGIAGPVLWQSFDYPNNMLLPGMKLGMNLKTGHSWSLTSWTSDKVPAAGAFRLGLDPDSDKLLVWRRGEVYWTSGVWKNGSFQSASQLTKRDDIYEFKFVTNENERYFSYSVKNRSIFSRWELDTLGQIEQFTLDRRDHSDTWIFETTSSCTLDTNNQSAVCLNEKPTNCRNGSDMFVPRKGYMDSYDFWYYDDDMSLVLSDCHTKCWNNCSCIAYQSSYENGTGCQFWRRGSKFTPNENFDSDAIYLLTLENTEEVPGGETVKQNPSRSVKDLWWIWLVVAIAFALAMLALGYFCHLRRRNQKILQQKGEKETMKDKSLYMEQQDQQKVTMA